MGKYILVIITSRDCGHCESMKENGTYSEMKRLINKFSRNNETDIKIVEIIKNSMRDRLSRKYPGFIGSRMSMWFPMIFIVREKYYLSDLDSNIIASKCKVLNGEMIQDEGKTIPSMEEFKYNISQIDIWLEDLFNVRRNEQRSERTKEKNVCSRYKIRKRRY